MKGIVVIQRISDAVNTVVKWLTVLLTVGFALIVFVSVLTRYVFNYPILWSVEVSKLLFVWSCFFAATIAYKNQAHIRFEFASRLLGEIGIKITDLAIHSLSLLFFGFILHQSILFFRAIWGTYFPVMEISQGWLYVSVTVSAVVFLIHNLALLRNSILSLSSKEVHVK